jgi:hypothetical protein
MLNIWTRDQTPELALRGAQSLGAGIQDFGASIGKAIDESKRLNTAGKASKVFLKANNAASSDDPDIVKQRDLATENLSNRDAIAAMTGMQQALGYQTAQGHFQEVLARLSGTKLANRGTAALPAFNKKLAEVLQGGTSAAPYDTQADYYENPERYSTAPRPTEDQAMAAALAQHSDATMSPQFDNSTQAIVRALRGSRGANTYPLGQQVTLPDGTVITGTGGVPHIRNPEKTGEVPPQNPLLVHKDAGTALAAAMGYTDPKERAAALDAVNKAQSAYGHPSILERILLGDIQVPEKGKEGAAKPGPKAGSSKANPVVVKTVAEGEALADGTWFQAPDGRVMQRMR